MSRLNVAVLLGVAILCCYVDTQITVRRPTTTELWSVITGKAVSYNATYMCKS